MPTFRLSIADRPLAAAAAFTAIAIAALTLAGCHSQEGDQPSQETAPVAPVVTAKRTALANKLTVAGQFLPWEEVELHAKVAGYIRSITIDIGDRVKQGQVVATLDVPELNAQVVGATAGVAQSREGIAHARGELARAEADHVALHSAAQRLADASKMQPGIIAEQELDNARARDRASESAVEAAKASLAASQQALNVSQAQRTQVSSMADYSRITVPFSGIITARYADPGALIQAGTSNATAAPVVKVASVDVLRLRLPVPESLASFVHDGDIANINVGALHRSFQGTVTRSTGALDPSTRTMQVEVDVPNKDHSITPGMYAQVMLDIHRAGNALAVPITAVDTSNQHAFVMLIDSGNHIVKRDVQTGISTANRIEIVSGLNAGDRIIATNLGAYTEGQTVTPKPSAIADAEGK
ncbi:MAG: efflux RND transporter periplasmic adaptor subunit [Acidobacteriaceae bacterium]|nr:efflux RND transporter periplasmic adaptor subunit [Acidobacteriaceae bacterium]